MNLSNYCSTKVFVLGILHLLLGALSFALGVAHATPTQGNFPYGQIGYGIWGGILYSVNGILAIRASYCPSSSKVISHLVLSIIVAVVASLQFSLGVASGMQDNAIMNIRWALGVHDDMPTPTLKPTFDPSASPVVIPPASTIDPETIRYYSNLLQYYCYYDSLPAFLVLDGGACQRFNGYNGVLSNALARHVHSGTVAVDCLLAISGLVMAIVAVLSATSGCHATCCSSCESEISTDDGMWCRKGRVDDDNIECATTKTQSTNDEPISSNDPESHAEKKQTEKKKTEKKKTDKNEDDDLPPPVKK